MGVHQVGMTPASTEDPRGEEVGLTGRAMFAPLSLYLSPKPWG